MKANPSALGPFDYLGQDNLKYIYIYIYIMIVRMSVRIWFERVINGLPVIMYNDDSYVFVTNNSVVSWYYWKTLPIISSFFSRRLHLRISLEIKLIQKKKCSFQIRHVFFFLSNKASPHPTYPYMICKRPDHPDAFYILYSIYIFYIYSSVAASQLSLWSLWSLSLVFMKLLIII